MARYGYGHGRARRPMGGVSLAQIAANRTQVSTTTLGITQNLTSRRQHAASPQGAVSNLRTVDVGWYYNVGTLVEANSPNAWTIKRYIEYPAGVFTQVTWGGAGTVTINPGSIPIVSDAVAGLSIPAGAVFWERTVKTNAGTTTIPAIELPASPQALGLADGNSLSDLGNSGTIAASSVVTTIGCAAILGDIAVAGARSFVVVGDSIAWGTGDATSAGAKGGSGYIGRGLDALYPYVKLALPGQQAADFAGSHSRASALLAVLNFSDAIVEHGLNDLRLGRTQTQLLADHQTIYVMFPGKRIYQATLTPRADSTDSYATVANQTPRTDGNMAALASVNATIRALPSNVTGIVEAADAAMSARDSGVWTAPPAAVADGTHPNSTKAAAMAGTIAAAPG